MVSKDEHESGLRAILNFGHTIGHAIETVTGYKRYLHGEAIAIGMYAAAELAVKSGIYNPQEASLIRELIESYALPALIPDDLSPADMISAMEIDKKVKAGRIKFVLPEAIGKVRLEDDVDRQLIRDIIAEHQSYFRSLE